MKIACPYCAEKITYDLLYAGRKIDCPGCGKQLLMGRLEQLPAEYQEQYRAEQEAIQRRQEAQQREAIRRRQALEAQQQTWEAQKQTWEAQKREQAEQRLQRRQREREISPRSLWLLFAVIFLAVLLAQLTVGLLAWGYMEYRTGEAQQRIQEMQQRIRETPGSDWRHE
jgi:DNA-directed RNA polymerase subunit RPC12/RpoP/Flp pilus assembly protein TadB